jgi:hypothetical protein
MPTYFPGAACAPRVAPDAGLRDTPGLPESGPHQAGEAHPSPVSDGYSNRAVMASDMLSQKLKTWKSGNLEIWNSDFGGHAG